ncbi:hypothetical protein ACE6H2_002478 [Prunus campanulata]
MLFLPSVLFFLASMDISLEIVYVGFFVVLLTWVLLDIMGRRRDGGSLIHRADRGCEVFALVTICSNALISIFYLGFGVYEYWGGGRIVSCKSIFSGMTWILATVVTLYAMNRTHSEQNRWPWVLVIWWIFACSFYVLYACLYLITHFISIDLPHILPKANIVDFASFPLSILLCFNAFSYAAQKNNDLKQPLLEKEDEAPPENTDTYSNAGIWSKATFQWLNPLFKRGRIQKLELPHIPYVPPSERAKNASSVLDESLGKQNMKDSSLSKAIMRAIGKSLATNAVFAEFVKEDQMKLKPCHDSEVSNVTVVLEPGEYAWKTKMSLATLVHEDCHLCYPPIRILRSSRPCLGRAVFLATIALQTAQRLFLGMITSVFRAPISFFDSTPSSRILSRCSTDQSTVDTDIPYRLAGLVFALIQLISIIILMSQVAWQVFILCLGVLALSMWYQVLNQCRLAEIVRQDQRLLDTPGMEI